MPTDQSAPPARKPAAALATASLILGILSVLACSTVFSLVLVPLYALAAMACGHVARRRAFAHPAPHKGADRAFLGEILGIIGLTAFLLLVPVLFEIISHDHPDRGLSTCRANLKQIGLACKLYSSDYSEHFPPDLKALSTGHYLDNSRVCTCPAAKTVPAAEADALAAHCDYLYFGGGKTEGQMGSNHVLVCDRTGNHRINWQDALLKNHVLRFHGQGVWNVVFADGHAAWYTGDDFESVVRRNHLILPPGASAGK